MLEFLTWLWGQASRVYNVIWYAYDSIIAAALYAYWWAVDEARSALGQAKAFALEKLANLKSWTIDWVDGVRNGLRSLIDSARAYTLKLYDKAIAWINDQIAWVRGLISPAIEALRAWAIGFVDKATATLKAWAAPLLDFLQKQVDKLSPFIPLLKKLTTLLSVTYLARLADLLGRLYAFVCAFVEAPLGWLYAIMRGTVTQFLSYAVGYGLGTVEAELPPWPQWGAGGDGDGIIIPPPPPYIPSGLIPPLAHLWISGYIFGPTHHATDFGAVNGEPVFAMHPGTITEAGWSNVGYGFDVVVSGTKWWSRYAHAQIVNVSVGDEVKAGAVIALANSTGNSTGPHLHLEIKRGGEWVNPVTVLPLG